jgi:glucan phosphoethanolaminetransferase (alkaline phosphatase superfamily)
MKSKIRYLLVLVYIAVIVVCLLMVVKPGVSIFYIKRTIDNQGLVPDAGFAFRYKLNINPFFYRMLGIRLFEDGQALIPSQDDSVVNTGRSNFSLSLTPQGTDYLYLSSSDNSDPITNGRKYTLYLPVRFISRPLGVILLIILLPGMVWFLVFALISPEHRHTIADSPKGILRILNLFLDHACRILRSFMVKTWQKVKIRAVFWKQLFTITILVAYLYIFLEWVFIVTMPSFMSMMALSDKLEVFLISGLALSLVCIAVIVALIILDTLALIANFSRFTSYLGVVIPTVILSTLSLLLIDNFTYTVFKFGISTSTGVWRGVYGLVLIALSVYIYFHLLNIFGLRAKATTGRKLGNWLFYISLGLVVVSIALAITRLDFGKLSSAEVATESQQAARYPNIILLGSDGVSADNMSLYGYERDTTPRLRELAQNSLVAENAFTNSSNSAGSIVSIFTGKWPTQTRVLYAPDILTGVNAYEHFPGLLKLNGYTTVEFGVPDYVDAWSLNIKDGFDTVNGRTQSHSIMNKYAHALGFENVDYFINKLTGRISDRIQHILFIRAMQNPYNIVTQPVKDIGDEEKITQMLDIIEKSQGPVFIHVHLLGTHGAIFTPQIRVYAKDEQQDQDWMVDFYDDAILSFDQYVGEVIDRLKADGQYENTVLIIYSDHAIKYRVNTRIPLIIHFPGDEFAGRISQNVQNMDIGPTILDYLGLPEPNWVEGESILKSDLDSHRLIFGAVTSGFMQDENGVTILSPQLIKPPFYQFNSISIIDCQKFYQFNLTTFDWLSGDVPGYTTPCAEESLYSFDEIKLKMVDRLVQDGFDVSSLP